MRLKMARIQMVGLKTRLVAMPKWKLLGEKQSGDFLKYQLTFEYTGKTYAVWYNLTQHPPVGFITYPGGGYFCILVSFVPMILYMMMGISDQLNINFYYKLPGFYIPFWIACFFSFAWSEAFWKVERLTREEKSFNRCLKVWFISLVPPYALVVSTGNIIVIGASIAVVCLILISVTAAIPEEINRYLRNLNELLTGNF